MHDIKEWSDTGLLNTQQAIQACDKFSTGRAYRYYEQEICNRNTRLSLDEYFSGLYTYIFPATFRNLQRDKFDACEQRGMSVRDYIRKLQDLSDTIGGLNDDDITLAFFRRANPAIRAALATDGYRADSTTLNVLEAKALAIEEGMEIARDAERKPREQIKSASSTPKASKSKPRTYDRVASSGLSRTGDSRPRRGGAPTLGTQRNSQPPRGNRPAYAPRQETQADRDRKKRLREEGKCFLCESPSHLAKDCDRAHHKKPPMQLNAMGMMSAAEVRLAVLDEGSSMGLYRVSIAGVNAEPGVNNEATGSERIDARAETWKVALAKIDRALPLPYDLLEDSALSPYSPERFSMIEYTDFDTYLLIDRHDSQEHVFTCGQLRDPSFNLVKQLVSEKNAFYDSQVQRWIDERHAKPEYDRYLKSLYTQLPIAFEDEREFYVPDSHPYVSASNGCFTDPFSDSDEELDLPGDEPPPLQALTDSYAEGRETPTKVANSDSLSNESDIGSDEDLSDWSDIFRMRDPSPIPEFNSTCGSPAPSTDSIVSDEVVPWSLDVLSEAEFILQCNSAGPSVPRRKPRHDPPSEPEVVHALERNAMKLKGFNRVCPKPIQVVVQINGHSCRALLDTGSLSDFMSTTLVDQLKVQKENLREHIPLQLACSGSRSSIHARATALLEYQNIKEERVFDVANLESYDLILGTPFMFQHKILLAFNPSQVVINEAESVPIRGVQTV